MAQDKLCGNYRLLIKDGGDVCIQVELDTKRHLTEGEKEIARKVFKDSIDYDKVFIHKGEYLWLGMQDDTTAMTPEGEIYFPSKVYKDDFSKSNAADKHFFIHEMTHVWQHQLGYNVKIKGLILHPSCKVKGCDPYNYSLSDEKKLCDYNMEQQGDIIADYFEYFLDTSPTRVYSNSGISYRNYTYLYSKVLSDFLRSPKSVSNLPKVK